MKKEVRATPTTYLVYADGGWLTLLAAASWEAGCSDAGGWANEAGGCLQRLQSVAANEVLLVGVEMKIMIYEVMFF